MFWRSVTVAVECTCEFVNREAEMQGSRKFFKSLVWVSMPSTLLLAASAHGQDNWQNSAGGSWGDVSNWSLNALPGQAVFDLGTAPGYTVTLPGTESGPTITVQHDNTTINLSGFGFTNVPNISVAPPSGQTGALTFTGAGTVGVTGVSPPSLVSVASGGTLTVNQSLLSIPSHSGLSVSGTLNLTSGGKITEDFTDGASSISTATLSNGTFQTSGGGLTAGSLSLSNHSVISPVTSFATSYNIGSATVDTSTISNDNPVSFSSLTVTGGGSVFGTGLTLGTASVVAGSTVANGGDPFTVQTSLSIQMTTGEATFGNVDTTFSGATLNLTLPGGVTPTQGSTYQPFDILATPGGSITSTFSAVNLPALSPGLSWDTSKLYTNGTVTVVPEPTTIGTLIGIATLALGRRRKRSIVQ
jgi:hypothetical protein